MRSLGWFQDSSDKTLTYKNQNETEAAVQFKMNLLTLEFIAILSFNIVFSSTSAFEAENDISFLLRVRNRPFKEEEVFKFINKSEIKSSAFDPNKPTTFLVHGFMEGRKVKHYLKLSK